MPDLDDIPDLDDRLRADGARWRSEIDRRSAHADASPFGATPFDATAGFRPSLTDRLRVRRTPRTSLLLSVAAITVATLVIGAGVVLASESDDDQHRSLPALTPSHTAPYTSRAAPTSRASSPAATRTHAASTGAHHTTPGHGRVTVPTGHSAHRTSQARSGSGTATGSSGPTACAAGALDVAVTAPSSAGDHDTLTITTSNAGTVDCTVSGFPTVSFPGESTIAVSQAADEVSTVVLAPGQAASAELDWTGSSQSAPCTSESSISVLAPSGGDAVTLVLDPPAQVCDPGSVVVHVLTAS